jgi:hypothetical protein
MRGVHLVVGGLAAAALAACGGESTAGTDPNRWSSSFCSLVGEWAGASFRPLRNAQAQLQSAPSEFTTATGEFDSRQVRQLLVRASAAAVRVDKTMLARYDARSRYAGC